MNISPVGFSAPKQSLKVSFAKSGASSDVIKDENGVTYVRSKSKFKKALPFIIAGTAALAGVALGCLIKERGFSISKFFKKTPSDNSPKIPAVVETVKQKVQNTDNKTWAALIALAGLTGYGAGKITPDDINEIINKFENGDTPLQKEKAAQINSTTTVYNAVDTSFNPNLFKYSKEYNGLILLNQTNALNRNSQKYDAAIKNIEEIGYEKLTSKNPAKIVDKTNPTVWSITSEFAPIKEGGLGSVPPEIRNNAEKLGVSMPTFVPMYLNNGKSSFIQKGNKFIYKYNKDEFPLKKIISFKMDVFKDGKSQSVPIEFYSHDDNGKKLILVKCDDYFDGTIYEASSKTEEPEKFAVLSKAVYEFAKAKTQDGPMALKDAVIYNDDVYDDIAFPDGIILNDWQASPTAALMRYKAPMENAYGQLSDNAAKQLKDMTLIAIGHNVMYQGSTQAGNDDFQRRSSTENILNTLFDGYTYDIVSHAKVHTERINKEDQGLKNLDNPLLMNWWDSSSNHTNLLNMGIVLSDYFCPVSQNYANEITSDEHPELSNSLRWALVQKQKAGKLTGVINGNDFNNLSINAKAKQIKNLTGLDFETYEKTAPLDEVLKKREDNKINLYENYILPFTNSSASSDELKAKVGEISQRLEFVQGAQGTTMPILSDEEIINTPILTSGGRFVSQKGLDVLCDAIKILFNNWDKDFPNRAKPIFYIVGADGENGAQRKILEDLKGSGLSKEDNDRVLFGHGFAPMAAVMAGADFFLMPSKFEPCGLTQGESLALATPVIASAVGGIVDTINRGGNINGILTDKNKPLDAQGFYEAIKEGLNIWFNDKDKYQQMVKNSLDEDFSWIKEGKQGPVYDYLDLLGIKRENLQA